VFVAGVAAAGVLGLAASSGPLFLASAGTAALHNEAAQVCPEAAVPAITDDRGPDHYPSATQAPAVFARTDAAVRAAWRAAGNPVAAEVVATAAVSTHGAADDSALLYVRSGALDHVHVVAGTRRGTGVWVPASYARAHALRPGSVVPLGSTRVRVAGVYRDLAPSAFVPLFALPRYWCSWKDAIVPTPFNRPPPLFLTDLGTLRAAAGSISATWYARTPVTEQTVPQAHQARTTAQTALTALHSPDYRISSQLGYLLAKAGRERSGLAGPVLPIMLAGVLVAAGLVAVSGVFWGLRRQRELRLLSSRGMAPAALTVKAMLELLPATVLGTLLGWGAGIVLVRGVGPSALLEPGAPGAALRLAAGTAVAGLLLAGVLGARTVPADRAGRRRRRVPGWVPWEITLLAGSVLAYHFVRQDGAVRIVKATVQLNPMVVAFPLLALTGAIMLLARTGSNAVVRSAATARRLPPAGYLAWRRLAGTPAVTLGALVGVALPIAVLVYAAALSGSTSSDVQRKYHTNVGAEYAFGTLARPGSTPDVHGHGTVVSMIQIDPLLDGRIPARVLGLDPASFGEYAFDGNELRPAIDRLGGQHGPVRALLVNAPAALHVATMRIRTVSIPVRIVARTASFPGLRDPYQPLLVVDRADLPRLDPQTDRTEEVWTDSGNVGAALAALNRDGVDANYEISTNSFLDTTGLRPVTWIFSYLRALAYLTGLVALAGLTFALTTRTRRRALAYHLSRRMSLSRRQHRRSLATEIGVLLAGSWATGIAAASAAVWLVYQYTDPYPASPPPPTLPVPVGIWAVTAVACGIAGAAAVLGLQRVLDRARPAPLLRIS
jgi:putative ABC transport system permease protein